MLRNLVDRLHCLQISTLDSFFLQIAGSFSLELGLPPGWRIVEAIDDKRLRYEAIQQVLSDHPVPDTTQLVRLLSKGEAMRSITEEIADVVAAMYEVYRETAATEPDVWKKLPQMKDLDAESLAEAPARACRARAGRWQAAQQCAGRVDLKKPPQGDWARHSSKKDSLAR